MSPEAASQLIVEGSPVTADIKNSAKRQARLALVMAISALLIWSTLAVSVVSISKLSPLLTTGIALAGGGLIGLPWVPWRALRSAAVAVGALAMFGYHALYFVSLRTADPVAANLLHYLWPLLMILFAPLMLKGVRMEARHIIAGSLGFAAACVCLAPTVSIQASQLAGLLVALVSAAIWAYYSVWSGRFPEIPTAAVSAYCLLAGIASLITYVVLGAFPSIDIWQLGGTISTPTSGQWLVLGYLAVGPLGGAFYLWDHSMKKGNPGQIALLAYAVPIASTIFVSAFLRRGLEIATALGAVLVTLAVAIGGRPARSTENHTPQTGIQDGQAND